jgi:hypothetical protein
VLDHPPVPVGGGVGDGALDNIGEPGVKEGADGLTATRGDASFDLLL